MKTKFLSYLSTFFQALLITGITVLAILPFSCKVSTEGIEIAAGDYDSPVIESVAVLDERRLELNFSEWVRIRNAVISPYISGISDSYESSGGRNLSKAISAAVGRYDALQCAIDSSDDGKSIVFTFEKSTKVGKNYEALGVVEDKAGNTLTFCIPFTGFNPKIPKVLITEVQPKYKGTVNKVPLYRNEFVELLALEDGNLCGLEVFFASYESKNRYELPPVEVHKGEVVLIHLRMAGDGCISELEENLEESTRTYSCDGVRDLWSDNKSKTSDYDNDILIVRNLISGEIMDGLMYSNGKIEEWEGSCLSFAWDLVNAGIYDSVDVDFSAESKNLKSDASKSLCRSDSDVLRKKLLSGFVFEESIKQDKNLWSVKDPSPGTL